ncbi:hypothetical protein [Lysinibacillus fusiformis]|uniref:hypothetical protein n=1 Tax=Lysinibacillus fusiformis TaxID=28031 RepID=UPI000691CC2F|nr:hypothetical protein [Lysinibacillus fusiformis]
MFKKMFKLVPLLILTLVFSAIASPIAQANEVAAKDDAINNSTYYSVKTHEIVLFEEEALSLNPYLENQELNYVKNYLENLSDEEIDEILIQNGYNLDDIKIDTELGHANIVWFVPIVVGAIIVAGGIIFSALYFSHKEKMTLIDKCYANGGYPEIDSKDKAGAKGTTDGGAATKAGGYKFECKKKK